MYSPVKRRLGVFVTPISGLGSHPLFTMRPRDPAHETKTNTERVSGQRTFVWATVGTPTADTLTRTVSQSDFTVCGRISVLLLPVVSPQTRAPLS